MFVEAPKAVGRWIAPLVLVASVAAAATDLRLVDAVKNRDRAAARALLTQKIDVNTAQPDGATALHWAAHWDDLRDGGAADPRPRTGERGQRLWRHAALARVHQWQRRHGHQTAAGGGESQRRAPLRRSASDDVRPLRQVEAVRPLLARGVDVNVKETSRGQTALMWAAAEGHADVVRLLIDTRADIRAKSTDGFTPLLVCRPEGRSQHGAHPADRRRGRERGRARRHHAARDRDYQRTSRSPNPAETGGGPEPGPRVTPLP